MLSFFYCLTLSGCANFCPAFSLGFAFLTGLKVALGLGIWQAFWWCWAVFQVMQRTIGSTIGRWLKNTVAGVNLVTDLKELEQILETEYSVRLATIAAIKNPALKERREQTKENRQTSGTGVNCPSVSPFPRIRCCWERIWLWVQLGNWSLIY